MRFLCLGIVANILLFGLYKGIDPRYLSFSVLFLCCLGAHLYCKGVPSTHWPLGLVLVATLFVFDFQLLQLEKQRRVEEIHYLERLKNKLTMEGANSVNQPIMVEGVNIIEEIQQFWMSSGTDGGVPNN